MSSKIRTIIVDDEALSRRGLEIRLLGTPDFEIVSQCANARVIASWVGRSFSSRYDSVSSEKTTPHPNVTPGAFRSSTVMSASGRAFL